MAESERIKQDYLQRQQKRQEELARYERQLEQRRLERQAQRSALRSVETRSNELLTSLTSATLKESIKTREVINVQDALKWKQIERQNEDLKTKRENMKMLLQQRIDRLREIEAERRRKRIPSKPKRFIVQPAEFYGINFSIPDCSRENELNEIITRRENQLLDEPDRVAQHEAQGKTVINALTDLQALLASPEELEKFVRNKVAQIRRNSLKPTMANKHLNPSIEFQQFMETAQHLPNPETTNELKEDRIPLKTKKWTDFIPKSSVNYSDVFDESIGKTPGVSIFRIEELQPVLQDSFQSLCVGDCYIVLNTFLPHQDSHLSRNDKFEYEIFQWIGPEASLDKKTCAAFFSVGLRNHLGSQTTVHREEGLNESAEFRNMLRLNQLELNHENSDQATPSGLFVVEKRQYPLLVYKVCSKNGCAGQEMEATLVQPKLASLNSANVFLIDNGYTIFLWSGKNSRLTDKMKCRLLAERIRKRERPAENVSLIEFAEGEEDESFSNLLNNDTDNETPDNTDSFEQVLDIFSISASDSVKLFEDPESAKIFTQNKRQHPSRSYLTSDKCFIIDLFNEVFLWIGNKSALKTRQLAEAFLMKCVFPSKSKRPSYTLLSKIMEGVESEVFKLRFPDWDFSLTAKVDFREVKPTNCRLTQSKSETGGMKIDIQALSAPTKNDKLSLEEEEKIEELFQRAESLLLSSQCFLFDEKKKKFVKQSSWDDKSKAGHLNSADCYVFLCIYRKQVSKNNDDGKMTLVADETAREFVAYVWLGRNHIRPSLAELTFMYDFQKTIEKLVDNMSDGNVKLRVVKLEQERENLALLSHFGRKVIVHAGKHDCGINFTRMFHIRTDPKYKVTRAIEVTPVFGSLVSRDAFLVFDSSLTNSFLWHGRGLSKFEEKAAFEVAQKIVGLSESDQNSSLIKIIRERGEPTEFWSLLGPNGHAATATDTIASGTGFYYIRPPPKLFRFSTRSGFFKAEDIGSAFIVPDLQTDTICLLDTVPGQGKAYPLYVWIGNKVSDVVLKLSKKSVETYLEMLNDGRTLQGSEWDPEANSQRRSRKITPDVIIVHENMETDSFRAYFHGWGSEMHFDDQTLQKQNRTRQDFDHAQKRFQVERKVPTNSFQQHRNISS